MNLLLTEGNLLLTKRNPIPPSVFLLSFAPHIHHQKRPMGMYAPGVEIPFWVPFRWSPATVSTSPSAPLSNGHERLGQSSSHTTHALQDATVDVIKQGCGEHTSYQQPINRIISNVFINNSGKLKIYLIIEERIQVSCHKSILRRTKLETMLT